MLAITEDALRFPSSSLAPKHLGHNLQEPFGTLVPFAALQVHGDAEFQLESCSWKKADAFWLICTCAKSCFRRVSSQINISKAN